MPPKSRRSVARFNKWTLGRLAHLFKQGWDKRGIAQYFAYEYGKKWNMGEDVLKMENYLFGSHRGFRPNISRLFEGKSNIEIKRNYYEWLKKETERSERMRKLHQDPEFQKRHKAQASERMRKLNQDPEFQKRQSERMRKLHQDPEFQKRQSERMRKLWKNPEWRNNQIELIRVALKRHWAIVRTGLRQEFLSRGIIFSEELKTGERGELEVEKIAATTLTPEMEAIENEKKHRVEKAIQELNDKEREAITAAFFEGHSLQEVAEIIGINQEQLDKLLDTAYRKLGQKLKEII